MFRSQLYMLDNNATHTQVFFRFQHLSSRPHLVLVRGRRQLRLLCESLQQSIQLARICISLRDSPRLQKVISANKIHTWQVEKLPWLKASCPIRASISCNNSTDAYHSWAMQVTRVTTFRKDQIYSFILGYLTYPSPDAVYQLGIILS